jgi:hypothetical protein
VLGHVCARTPSLSLSTTCPFDFGIVPTVWYILELFRQCGIFYFHFIIVTQRLPKTLQLKKKEKKAVKFRFFRTTDGGIFGKTPFLQML